MIEPINVTMKSNLHTVAGSLNISMPANTVPTAPIPVTLHKPYQWAGLVLLLSVKTY